MPRAPLQLVWFKRDLRWVDHEPLARAAARGPVLPLYVFEPEYWLQPDTSVRQYRPIHAALIELREALAALGQPLVVRIGEVVGVLDALAERWPIAALYSHQETGNAWTYARDLQVAAWCRARSVPWFEFRQFGVVRGLRRRVHWSRQWEALMAEEIRPTPAALVPLPEIEPGPIPTPSELTGDGSPAAVERGGRRAALARLESFLAHRGEHYTRQMSSPLSAEQACSRLSVALATGALSLREVVQAARRAREAARAQGPTAAAWVRALTSFEARLHWHCHFIQKLESEPELEFRNVHRGYDGMREADFDPVRFQAWARGETGWPFVDACMRMLGATGWLNFRMRAMLMAIAAYHYWLHWREPALHLARLFTDYEPGIHYPQAQMQSGVTGINVPRIYNPVKQGLDQDPAGVFVARWIPELAALPMPWRQQPWLAPSTLLRRAGVRLDGNYPRPRLDHEQAARQARQRLGLWQRRPRMREQSLDVLIKHGSRMRRLDAPPARPSLQADLFDRHSAP